MPRRDTWGLLNGLPFLRDRTTGRDLPTITAATGDPNASRFVPAAPVAPAATSGSPTGGTATGSPTVPSGADRQTYSFGDSNPAPAPSYGLASREGLLDVALPGETHADRAANVAIDRLTGLPFGLGSTLLNPRIVDTSWGTPFNTGGGGLIGAGGELSRRNLERVYDQALREHAPSGSADDNYLQEAFGGGVTQTYAPGAQTNFYAPGNIPGVNTPIATHEGFIPGTRVVSGNTDLITGLSPQGDHQNVFADEVDAFAQERIREEQRIAEERRIAEAEAQRQAQLAQDQALARAAAEQAARQAAERAAAEQARIAAAQAEQNRREQEAAAQARAEAQRQENIRRANEELARRNREREESGQAQQQGRAVTDSRGNPVRDSSGGIVTDRPTQRSDDNGGGGGGGGGTWCCTAAMKHGMPVSKVKALRKWHRTKSAIWQNGYDQWGYYIAEKLVKGSPFWSSVTEAGHDLFVNKKITPKGVLAWLVIAPGSYIAGVIDAIQK